MSELSETGAALFDRAWSEVEDGLDALPPRLAALWAPARIAWEARVSGGPRALFLSDLGTPAFTLLAWGTAVGGLPVAHPRARAAARAMLWTYLAVRIQDDLVDDGRPLNEVYLQQAFSARAWVELAAAVETPDALAALADTLWDFGEAALQDLDVRQSDALAPGAEQGRKYLPMVPAIAAVAGPDRLDTVRAVVEAAGVALQLTNDWMDVPGDLARRLRSPVTDALGLDPRIDPPSGYGPAARRAVLDGRWAGLTHRIGRAWAAVVEAAGPHHPEALTALADARTTALRLRVGMQALHARHVAAPMVLDVEVTRECNLRCPDCFVFAQEPDLRPGHLPALSLAQVRAIIDELTGYDGVLHLTGGEPLGWPGVWDAVAHAAARGIPRLTINTNGTLLDEDAVQRLASCEMDVHLMVSVDGPPGTQDRARGFRMEEAALAALRRARAAGVPAAAATILSDELVAYGIPRWLGWLDDALGAPTPLVLWPLFQKTDQKRDGVGLPMRPSAARRLAADVAALQLAGRDVVVADYPLLNPLLRRHGVPEEALWQCTAGRARLAVQADGVVSPCHPFRHPLGDLKTEPIAGFIARALATASARRLAARDHDDCRSCDHRAVCGSCQALSVARGAPFGGNAGACRPVVFGEAERSGEAATNGQT